MIFRLSFLLVVLLLCAFISSVAHGQSRPSMMIYNDSSPLNPPDTFIITYDSEGFPSSIFLRRKNYHAVHYTDFVYDRRKYLFTGSLPMFPHHYPRTRIQGYSKDDAIIDTIELNLYPGEGFYEMRDDPYDGERPLRGLVIQRDSKGLFLGSYYWADYTKPYGTPDTTFFPAEYTYKDGRIEAATYYAEHQAYQYRTDGSLSAVTSSVYDPVTKAIVHPAYELTDIVLFDSEYDSPEQIAWGGIIARARTKTYYSDELVQNPMRSAKYRAWDTTTKQFGDWTHWECTYDNLGRITEWTFGHQHFTASYDEDGIRTDEYRAPTLLHGHRWVRKLDADGNLVELEAWLSSEGLHEDTLYHKDGTYTFFYPQSTVERATPQHTQLTALWDDAKQEIQLHLPNPEPSQWTMYSLLGSMVLSGESVGERTSIAMSSLASGPYFVVVSQAGRTMSAKIHVGYRSTSGKF